MENIESAINDGPSGAINAAMTLTETRGDLEMATLSIQTLPQRVQDKIMPVPFCGCWIWMGALTEDGYGSVGTGDRTKTALAHRYVYSKLKGDPPRGTEQDHLCRIRSCVNPEHTEPVIHKINIDRGDCGIQHRRKTHCPAGHPYAGENLYKNPNRQARTCRTCMRQHKINFRQRQRRNAP